MLNRLKSPRGSETVEFAIVSALLFTLLMGILEGGRVLNGWLVITNEAMEAARWGAVRVGDPSYASLAILETAVEDFVATRTEGVLSQDPDLLAVESTVTQETVTVHIGYRVVMISPLMSGIWPDFQLTATSTMRSE